MKQFTEAKDESRSREGGGGEGGRGFSATGEVRYVVWPPINRIRVTPERYMASERSVSS